MHDVSDGVVRGTSSFIAGARVGLAYMWLDATHEGDSSADYKEAQSQVHAFAASTMLSVCKSHGGLYNKGAQYLSTQNHVLPEQYTSALAELQDNAAGVPFRDVAEQIRRELGPAALGSRFTWFDPKPVAAASLAQVHRAVDAQGRACAVKVQYPRIDIQIAADIAAMSALLEGLQWVWSGQDLSWMLPQFKENLSWELDFAQDGRNGTRCGALLASSPSSGLAGRVVVPRVHWDNTTNKVLTMEWVSGAKATDRTTLAALGIDPAEVAGLVSRAFADMNLRSGLVHIDPHPGNLLIRRKPGAPALPPSLAARIKTFPSHDDVKAMLAAGGGDPAAVSFEEWLKRGADSAAVPSGAGDFDTARALEEVDLEDLADTLEEGAAPTERIRHSIRSLQRLLTRKALLARAEHQQTLDEVHFHLTEVKHTVTRVVAALACIPALAVLVPSVVVVGGVKKAIPAEASASAKRAVHSTVETVKASVGDALIALRDAYNSAMRGGGAAKAASGQDAESADGAAAPSTSQAGHTGPDQLEALSAQTSQGTSVEVQAGSDIPIAGALRRNSDWQLVLLDHGMYRRLDPNFRMANTALWRALASREAALGTAAVIDMGVPVDKAAQYFEIMCLLLTFRPSSAPVGGRMSAEERAAIRARFEKGGDLHLDGPEAVSEFIKALPLDMLFALRNTAIVRGVNKALGGTTLTRVQAMARAIADGYATQHTTVDVTGLSADETSAYDANGYKYLTDADMNVLAHVHSGADGQAPQHDMWPVLYPHAPINLATDTEMELLAQAGALPAELVRRMPVQGLVAAVQARLQAAAESEGRDASVPDVLTQAAPSTLPSWLDNLLFSWVTWLGSAFLGVVVREEEPSPHVSRVGPAVQASVSKLTRAEKAALEAPATLAAARKATLETLQKEQGREADADRRGDDVHRRDWG